MLPVNFFNPVSYKPITHSSSFESSIALIFIKGYKYYVSCPIRFFVIIYYIHGTEKISVETSTHIKHSASFFKLAYPIFALYTYIIAMDFSCILQPHFFKTFYKCYKHYSHYALGYPKSIKSSENITR